MKRSNDQSTNVSYLRVAVRILVITFVILHGQLHVANFAREAFLMPVLYKRTSISLFANKHRPYTQTLTCSEGVGNEGYR